MFKNGIVITGPIGSGKSEALKIIKKLGYLTVDLDVISNEILESDKGIKFLDSTFPDCINENSIDRTRLANIVFKNKDQLNILESFLHPKVQEKLLSILKKNEGFTFIEVSAPKSVIDLFKCVVIWSPKEVRIKRLLDRGMDEEDITNRINNQPNDEWWYSIGTLIENNKIEDLENKLIHEIQKLL